MSKVTYKTYKDYCLNHNPKLRASKIRGTALYHIIEGEQRCYRPYSNSKDTINEAWKDCYERIIENTQTTVTQQTQ